MVFTQNLWKLNSLLCSTIMTLLSVDDIDISPSTSNKVFGRNQMPMNFYIDGFDSDSFTQTPPRSRISNFLRVSNLIICFCFTIIFNCANFLVLIHKSTRIPPERKCSYSDSFT